MHSEFTCEFIVLSNHDHSSLKIAFCCAQNLFCFCHRIKNCATLEIGVEYIQNLHVNSQYSQIMATLPQKLLFAVHRNIKRYVFHFVPMEKQMNQITAIFMWIMIYYTKNKNGFFCCHSASVIDSLDRLMILSLQFSLQLSTISNFTFESKINLKSICVCNKSIKITAILVTFLRWLI